MDKKLRDLMYAYEHLIKENGFSAFVETVIALLKK